MLPTGAREGNTLGAPRPAAFRTRPGPSRRAPECSKSRRGGSMRPLERLERTLRALRRRDRSGTPEPTIRQPSQARSHVRTARASRSQARRSGHPRLCARQEPRARGRDAAQAVLQRNALRRLAGASHVEDPPPAPARLQAGSPKRRGTVFRTRQAVAGRNEAAGRGARARAGTAGATWSLGQVAISASAP